MESRDPRGRTGGFVALAVLATLAAPLATGVGARPADDAFLDDPVSLLFTRSELSRLEALEDDEERREFLARFWERRDPDPATTVNEFRDLFNERVAYADKRFGGRYAGPGWKTPPGLLVIVLGPPDEEVRTTPRYVFDGGLRSLVIWHYREVVGSPLTVPFIDARDGLKLAFGKRNQDAARTLRRRLERARLEHVHRDGVIRDVDSVVELDSPRLPARVVSVSNPERIAADLAIPVAELFGRPADRGVRFQFTIEVRDESRGDASAPAADPGSEAPNPAGKAADTETEAADSPGTGSSSPHDGAEVDLVVVPEELGDRLGGDLHVTIVLPRSSLPEGTVPAVLVTETATGRSAMVPLADPLDVDEGSTTPDPDASGLAPADRRCAPARRALLEGIADRGRAVLYLVPCEPDDEPGVATLEEGP